MLTRKKEISQEANENKSETRRFPVARKKTDTKPNKAKQSNQKTFLLLNIKTRGRLPTSLRK